MLMCLVPWFNTTLGPLLIKLHAITKWDKCTFWLWMTDTSLVQPLQSYKTYSFPSGGTFSHFTQCPLRTLIFHCTNVWLKDTIIEIFELNMLAFMKGEVCQLLSHMYSFVEIPNFHVMSRRFIDTYNVGLSLIL